METEAEKKEKIKEKEDMNATGASYRLHRIILFLFLHFYLKYTHLHKNVLLKVKRHQDKHTNDEIDLTLLVSGVLCICKIL